GLSVHGQPPAGLVGEPARQFGGVLADEAEVVVVRGQQWVRQQGASRTAPFGVVVGRKGRCRRRRRGRDRHRAAACRSRAVRSMISTTCSGPDRMPSSVWTVTTRPASTSLRRISIVPSPLVTVVVAAPGRRAASASPRTDRNSRNVLGSSPSGP